MDKLRLVWLFILVVLVSHAALAKPIKVGVVGTPPFVVDDGKIIDGISVQIWQEIAELENFKYELVKYDSEAQVLSDVKHGKLEFAIGPISITAKRAEEVNFTQPYYRSDLGILTHIVKRNLYERAKPFLSRAFIYGVLFLLALLALVGALVWLTERRENSEEFPEGATGLFNGMWFAVVTMTTVGYGDRCPRSRPGRLITAAWMLIATVSYSTLTAGIATALTLSSMDGPAITGPQDLRGQRVGVIAAASGAAAAEHFGATNIGCKNLEEAAQHLLNGSVDAVVSDMPALRYFVQKHPDEKYVISKTTFESQHYGFAVNVTSKRLSRANVALLTLRQNGQIGKIVERWMSGQ